VVVSQQDLPRQSFLEHSGRRYAIQYKKYMAETTYVGFLDVAVAMWDFLMLHSIVYEIHSCPLCSDISRCELFVKIPSLLLDLR